MNDKPVDLSVVLGKIKLKNPVMPSSGTFGYGIEFTDFLNLNDLGAVIVKGTTLHPRLGNFQHRFTEVAGCTSISTIGLQNVGVERFIKDKLPALRQYETPVIVNIAGESIEEFTQLTETLTKVKGIAGLEINLACPNVKEGGAAFTANPETTFRVVQAVRNATDLTIIPKLAPSAVDMAVLAKICEEAGADAICPNFSILGMAIDIHTRKSKLGKNLMASVGGPWMKPISVRLVWQAVQVVKIPVIGVGGITSAEDAIEFILAGATAVQIGIYNFIDPSVTIKTIEGIRNYMIEKGIYRIADLRGGFLPS